MLNALIMTLLLLTSCASCTEVDRQKLIVPVLTKIDAIAWTLKQAVTWCEAHGIDKESVAKAKDAIERKDLGEAIDLIRVALHKTADSGTPVPPEIVALVDTAEEAIAANVVQDFARAVSTPTPSAAPLPSSGL